MRWVEATKEPTAASRTPAVLSHVALAIQRKGKSAKAAWNIARASLIKHGYLKGPYHEKDKGNPKMTGKGQKASARHASEPDAPDKFKKFGKDFSKVVEEQERSFELIEINDLRPIDWYTGKRVSLSPGMGSICQRCGKEHAIVWKVEETTPGKQRIWSVGSGCGPKILAGWSPDENVIKAWLNRDKVQALVTSLKKEIRRAKKFSDTLRGKATPEPDRSPSKYQLKRERGLDDITIKGFGTVFPNGKKTGVPLTPEDMSDIRSRWIESLAKTEGFDQEFSSAAAAMDQGRSEDDILMSSYRPWAKIVVQAKKLGVLGTMKDITETHHRKDGKFSSPDSAHIVVKDGERYKVVRQLRKVSAARRLDKAAWAREGDSMILGFDSTFPERYSRVDPAGVQTAILDAAKLFNFGEPRLQVTKVSPYIVRATASEDDADGSAWGSALRLAVSTGHVPFIDPYAEGGGVRGQSAFDELAAARSAYLMRRVW